MAARMAAITMEDRTKKTLVRIAVAPITHFEYLSQNLLAFALMLWSLNVLVVALGVLVHGDALISPFLGLLIFTFYAFTSLSYALAWYSLFRSLDSAYNAFFGVTILLSMLGGLMWPIQAMPTFFQRFARLLPTYWLSEALLLAPEAGLKALSLPLGMMVLFSLAFLLIGSRRSIA